MVRKKRLLFLLLLKKKQLLDIFSAVFGSRITVITIPMDKDRSVWTEIDEKLAFSLKEDQTYEVKGFIYLFIYLFCFVFLLKLKNNQN